MKKFFIAFLFSLQHFVYGQNYSLDEADSLLTVTYEKIMDIRLGSRNFDSIVLMNRIFKDQLVQTILENPSSLTFKFKKLNEKISFTDSEDGLLRIYSWDTWLGGTAHDFRTIFQFRSGSNTFTKLDTALTEPDIVSGGGFYSQIFVLKVNQKTYYLAIDKFVFSTKDVADAVECFVIENNYLKEAKIIKTPNGMTNTISFEYDFFSVVNRPERPVKLIQYDADKKILRIPVVIDKGKVTARFLDYHFNGNYFEYSAPKVKTQ